MHCTCSAASASAMRDTRECSRVFTTVFPKQPSLWKPAHLLLRCSNNQDGSCWSLIWHIIQGIHLEQA